MTNDIFPLLRDENVLKTTLAKIIQKTSLPTNPGQDYPLIYAEEKKIIVAVQKESVVSIYDATGYLIHSQRVTFGKHVVKILTSGLYIVCVDNVKKKTVIK
jgi:hypothetical protein